MHCWLHSCRRGKVKNRTLCPWGGARNSFGLQEPMPVPLEVSYLWGKQEAHRVQPQTWGRLATGAGVGQRWQEHWESSSIQGNREPSLYHEPGSSSVPPGEGQECGGYVETPSSCEIIRHMPVGTTMKSHYAPLRTRKKKLLFSPSVVSDSLWPHGPQHTRLPCPSPSPGACSDSCHRVSDAILPSHPLLSPSPPAFSLSQHQGQLFPSGGRSIGASASAQVVQMNIQDWFPLRLTGLISCCPRDSRVFSSTRVLWHQFFTAQPFLLSSSHIHTWLLEKKQL